MAECARVYADRSNLFIMFTTLARDNVGVHNSPEEAKTLYKLVAKYISRR